MSFLWTRALLAVPFVKVGSLVMPLVSVGPTGHSRLRIYTEVFVLIGLGALSGPSCCETSKSLIAVIFFFSLFSTRTSASR